MGYNFESEILVEQPYINVHWDEAGQIVVMEWKRSTRGNELRNGLDSGLDVVKEKGAVRWLADLRKIGVVSPDDQEWSNNDWFPRAIEAGVSLMAMLIPQKDLARMTVDNIVRKVSGLETRYFDTVDEARQWLLEEEPA